MILSVIDECNFERELQRLIDDYRVDAEYIIDKLEQAGANSEYIEGLQDASANADVAISAAIQRLKQATYNIPQDEATLVVLEVIKTLDNLEL